MSNKESFFRRHKILTTLGVIVLVLIVVPMIWLQSRARGPYHDYELDFLVPAANDPTPAGVLQVGVSKRDVTPNFDLYDSWTDVNNNGKYDEGIDTYVDRNGNGRFDGIWMAGFGTNRPAKGVNDPMWVRAIALRNNGVTLVMVTIDSIGIFHNEYIRIRKMINPALGIDHIMFSATHSHEVPDTMKIWSYGFRLFGLDIPYFGYDHGYMEFIQDMAREAIEEAVARLEPADMYCAQVYIEPEGFVRDSRKPVVMDNHMYLFRFTKHDTDETIATLVNWGNHPEALGSRNSYLTSDFPHWLREGLEKGVPPPNGVEGFGGMCLYFQGMLGGLMTPLGVEVPHRDGVQKFKEDSFEKAESLGYNCAIVAAHALRSDLVWKNENPKIAVAAKTYLCEMEGMYKWAIRLGLLHEGYYRGGKAKSEVNVIRIGDVTILTTPGELYPEVVEGGIEALPGRDFEIHPVEVPPLRGVMEKHARMAFVVGLANDEIGYMVPKSQWDTKPPWVHGKKQYGEENSGGPEIAATYHREARDLLNRMNDAHPGAAKAAF
ncbi:MAG TPA: hypothetical protein ENN65_05840 [Candidatus Hydrogenedentes bacterium]|nr:hypothetical protein [Candidatus Hydrogenedentota bacterium]